MPPAASAARCGFNLPYTRRKFHPADSIYLISNAEGLEFIFLFIRFFCYAARGIYRGR